MSSRSFLLACILLGFTLRVYHLGAFGFWADEARTGVAARLSLVDIVRFSQSLDFEHPPLYFMMLHGWIKLAGESEWSWRFLAVIWGTLSIPLALVLYRSIADRRLAALAAAYFTFSPFLVSYSQENRMYAWICFLSILSTLLLLKSISSRAGKWPILYLLIAAIGTFSHYFFAMLVSAHVAYLWLVFFKTRARQYFRAAASLTGIIALLALVVAGWVLMSTGPRSMVSGLLRSNVSLSALFEFWLRKLAKVAMDFMLAEPRLLTIPPVILLCVALGWGLVFYGGLKELLKPGLLRKNIALLLLLTLFLPLIEIAAVYKGVAGRFFMFAAPSFVLLCTTGLYLLLKKSRLIGAFCLCVLVVTTGYGLYQNYALTKGEFHVAAEYIRENARPGDIVLTTHPFLQPLAEFYLNGSPAIPVLYSEAFSAPTTAEVAERVPLLVAGASRVWLGPVDTGTLDPERVLEHWLSQNAFPVVKKWFPMSSSVALFVLPTSLSDTAVDATTDNGNGNSEVHTFGGVAELRSVHLDAEEISAGSGMLIALEWQIIERTQNSIMVELSLHDAEGRAWARRVSSMQGELLTSQEWFAGQEIQDNHGLWITEGTPPGTYGLRLSLYDATLQRNLPVADQDYLLLGEIKVLPGTMPVPSVPSQLALPGLVQLLGSDQWPTGVVQGTNLPMALYWLPLVDRLPELSLRLELLNRSGGVVSFSEDPLGISWYPTTQWSMGLPVKSLYALPIPGRLDAGRYQLQAIIRTGSQTDTSASPAGVKGILGEIEVEAMPRTFRGREPAFQAAHTLGDVARLAGYDIIPAERAPAGSVLDLVLHWEAIGEPDVEYTVFTHLIGSDGQTWGQKDNPPANGKRPTTTWVKGERIIDEYSIPVDTNAPDGEYVLYVGMYNPRDGVRLEATDGRMSRWPNDAIPLLTISIGR